MAEKEPNHNHNQAGHSRPGSQHSSTAASFPQEKPKLEEASTSEADTTTPGDGGFAPIRTGPSRNHPPVARQISLETLSTLRRERSNNGFGVDDIEQGADGAVVAPYNHPNPSSAGAIGGASPERDPYEVGWDGGDADPMCPRSMPTWRKWLIVGITSVGSFCV